MVLHFSSLFVLLAAHLVLVMVLFTAHLVLVVALFTAHLAVVVSPLLVLAVLSTHFFRFWLRTHPRRASNAKKQRGDPDDGLHGELLGNVG
jgi:membrane protein implicated in regulation of membrane protease activity